MAQWSCSTRHTRAPARGPSALRPWIEALLIPARAVGGRGEPVPLDDVVQPVGMAVGQPVFPGQFGGGARFRCLRGQHVGELTEVALEAARNDDFDDPAGYVTGVPHGVHLPARLDDVAARPEDQLDFVRPETYLPCEHTRILH